MKDDKFELGKLQETMGALLSAPVNLYYTQKDGLCSLKLYKGYTKQCYTIITCDNIEGLDKQVKGLNKIFDLITEVRQDDILAHQVLPKGTKVKITKGYKGYILKTIVAENVKQGNSFEVMFTHKYMDKGYKPISRTINIVNYSFITKDLDK